VAAQVGDSFGRPVIAKTAAYGWVVLLTSGYFDANATPTSNGHLFVLDAATGALIANLSTTGGPSLAQLVAAVIAPSNPTISRVYGGDLDGNLWRFDLSSANPGTSPWTTTLVTTLVDASGVSQPITAAPQVGQINGSPVVFVGTGRLLSASDPSGISGNTFYAVMDDTRSMPIPALRSNLTRHTLSSSGGVTSVNTVTMDWTRYRGWYVDVSSGSGERFLSQAQLIQGVVYAVSNTPSGTPCSSASNLYAFDYQSGNELPASRFPGAQPWVQLPIGMTLASLPTVVQLASGQLVGLIHRADNSVDSVDLPAPPPNVLGKAAWREVVH
jgi:type IV pilus assembly protein PilY1